MEDKTWRLVVVLRNRVTKAIQRNPSEHASEEAARAEYTLREGNVSG